VGPGSNAGPHFFVRRRTAAVAPIAPRFRFAHPSVPEDWRMSNPFEKLSTRIAAATGRPPAFALALTVIIVWAITGPLFQWSDTWQLVINTGTTIVTFLMVFLIQNAQNRDASAIQAKLDELIRAVQHARNEFIGIEHLSELELREILGALEVATGDEKHKAAAIARLITRR
jgi:low affinity Fe/Cu permease